MEVEGKVILITGGAGGIGLAVVQKLLENGAKGVAIVDICEEKISEFDKKRVIFVKTDVTVKKELENAFESTIRIFKQLDIVINNAGISNEIDWKKTVAVNLVAVIEGTYLAMEKYLPIHKSGEEGVVINTASVLGLTTVQTIPVYCATKHALVGFGKSVGGEEFYNKYKVRILTLCPGLVNTSIIKTTEKVLFPHLAHGEMQAINPVVQSSETVGEALIEIVRKGKSGSLWVIEDEKPVYEVVEAHRSSMKV